MIEEEGRKGDLLFTGMGANVTTLTEQCTFLVVAVYNFPKINFLEIIFIKIMY
jgi:hypothetical protein